MANREPYGTGPQDVDVVRLEMMANLVGKHKKDEILKFFYEKVNPAFDGFFEFVKTLSYTVKGIIPIWKHGQTNKLDANDYYSGMESGIELTANESFFFYYYVYATSAPYPPWDDYTVLVKWDGKRGIINNLDECSKDALFDNMKQSLLEAKAQIED